MGSSTLFPNPALPLSPCDSCSHSSSPNTSQLVFLRVSHVCVNLRLTACSITVLPPTNAPWKHDQFSPMGSDCQLQSASTKSQIECCDKRQGPCRGTQTPLVHADCNKRIWGKLLPQPTFYSNSAEPRDCLYWTLSLRHSALFPLHNFSMRAVCFKAESAIFSCLWALNNFYLI